MTIAVVWQEDGRLWCAADTRFVAGKHDAPTTEIGSKIYSIPLAISAFGSDGWLRSPHFSTQYGFIYAGAALPASMTAVSASTLLQKLARPGDQASPPRFEEVSKLVHRLAQRFILERRRFGSDGLFSASFFGWCPYDQRYKVAYIDAQDVRGKWDVKLSFPAPPASEGEPWLILGSGSPSFTATLQAWRTANTSITRRIPLRIIQKMVAEGTDATVGGGTSIGIAHERGFDLYFALEAIGDGSASARMVFNGLDLQTEVGPIGEYVVAINGMA